MHSDVEIAAQLAKAWRFFYNRGFVDGFGHISARLNDAERMLISRHNLGKQASPVDFVVVDLEGRQIGTAAPLPGELPIHLEIYKLRPDVASIAHFHCLYATSFSMTKQALKPTYFLASIFREGIPVHLDSRLINNQERGKALAATLGAHRAALLKAHGVVVTGRDVQEMVAAAFILEDNARRTWVSATLGKVEALTDEVMAEVEAEILKSRGPFQRIWGLCEDESVE
ncbi:MAG TPA: class II aldolase/adducin family protein [Methylocella sp.]|nr:class II aldolase/adducin family protein [Methylocella sp.]